MYKPKVGDHVYWNHSKTIIKGIVYRISDKDGAMLISRNDTLYSLPKDISKLTLGMYKEGYWRTYSGKIIHFDEFPLRS